MVTTEEGDRMATTETSRPRAAGDLALLEALSDPWRLINTPADQVRKALAGAPNGDVNAFLAGLAEAKRALREGVELGKVVPWRERPVQEQSTLATVGATMAYWLQADPTGAFSGVRAALAYLIVMAQVGWQGNLYTCDHCGRLGAAKRTDRRWCSDACRKRAERGGA